jgi:hypothetical protein
MAAFLDLSDQLAASALNGLPQLLQIAADEHRKNTQCISREVDTFIGCSSTGVFSYT